MGDRVKESSLLLVCAVQGICDTKHCRNCKRFRSYRPYAVNAIVFLSIRVLESDSQLTRSRDLEPAPPEPASGQSNRKCWEHLDPMPFSILLVDDNAVQAATRQAILRRAGYYVTATLSAERALEQVQAGMFAVPLGLVITDHLMPGMSGSVFVRLLRQTHPLLPVMVISGLEEAETEYEGLRVVFRVKPLMPEILLANVQSLMETEGVATDPNR